MEEESRSSVVVMDAACWTDAMCACVHDKFPDASVAVRQSSTSLSGFSVAVTLLHTTRRRDDGWMHHARGMLLLGAGFAAAMWMHLRFAALSEEHDEL